MLIAAQVCSSALHSTVTTIKAPLLAIAASYMYIVPTKFLSIHPRPFLELFVRL